MNAYYNAIIIIYNPIQWPTLSTLFRRLPRIYIHNHTHFIQQWKWRQDRRPRATATPMTKWHPSAPSFATGSKTQPKNDNHAHVLKQPGAGRKWKNNMFQMYANVCSNGSWRCGSSSILENHWKWMEPTSSKWNNGNWNWPVVGPHRKHVFKHSLTRRHHKHVSAHSHIFRH